MPSHRDALVLTTLVWLLASPVRSTEQRDMDRIAELEQQLRSSEERETHLLQLSQSLRLKVKETEQWLSAARQHNDQEPASHAGGKTNAPSLRTSYAGDGKNSIALCISGQVGRTQPDNTFERLIQTNPEFSFTLF